MSIPQFQLDEVLAFLPGIVNLVPLIWLLSRNIKVKQAGGLSGIMGGAQFLLPQAAIAYYAAGPGAGGQGGNLACSVSIFLLPWLAPGMIVLWLACVVLGVAALHGITR